MSEHGARWRLQKTLVDLPFVAALPWLLLRLSHVWADMVPAELRSLLL